MAATKGSVRIDVTSDWICPWCLIGTRRLERALSSLPEVVGEVSFHPFLLDPDTPADGVDLRDRLRRKYGDPEPLFRRVEAVARADGIDLDFSRVGRSFSTVRAHTLVRHAREKGTQRALAKALFGSYFLEGRDLNDPDVLVGLAQTNGFSPADARAVVLDEAELGVTRNDARQASERGISGVPHVVIGGQVAISGAQSVEVFRQAIERAAT